MNRRSNLIRVAILCSAMVLAVGASAQGQPDPRALIAAQQQAIAPLAFMDGEWRGTARTTLPDGSKHVITQTERVGSFLDGAVKVVEGRGYDADGTVVFNALGVVYFDQARKVLRFQTHAMGRAGDYSFTPTADGFVWEIPAGPATVRYTATIKGGKWHEVGDRVMPGAPDARFFEMTLQRIGDSPWPAAGAVPSQ